MEHSPKGTSVRTGRVAALAGRLAPAALGAGSQQLGLGDPKGLRSSPRSTLPARPAPPRVERATPGLPRHPLPSPHASPLSARRSWICVGRGKARLPFMAESATAAVIAAAAGRAEREAEPRAGGRRHRSGAGGERGARRGGGGGVGGPGRAGGGEEGEGGEPGRQRSGPPLTAARRGDV